MVEAFELGLAGEWFLYLSQSLGGIARDALFYDLERGLLGEGFKLGANFGRLLRVDVPFRGGFDWESRGVFEYFVWIAPFWGVEFLGHPASAP